MKKFVLTLYVAVHAFAISAQKLPAFKPMRYDEDYFFLKADSTRDWYQRIKYSSLNNRTYISYGGDIRFQYFNVKNEGWGEEQKDKDGYVFSRYLLHADLHAGKHFRSFVQLQSTLANGKISTSPVDENPLELHQGFIDVNPFWNYESWVLITRN